MEKVVIKAYNDQSFSDAHFVNDPANPFTAMINPETYSLDYKVEFTDGQGHGTSSAHQRFNYKKPDEMSFEFLFDNTGIIDNNPLSAKDLSDKIEGFKKLLLELDSDSHEPRHFIVAWGSFIFKGRCTGLTISYKLFDNDGNPIRAVCKTTFKGSIDEQLRVAQDDQHSPDITHYRVVKSGETLPWLCFLVYGDSKYYLQIAQVNKLTNFRQLKQGQQVSFPPINNTGNA
ncbi:MAG TPA: hypothetical protein VHC47_05555 [Mucilaginibacter sp.]|nr:hypothetical protein [Mucilaginibacter sp.]